MEFDNLITSPLGLGEKLILELLRRGESVFAIFPTPKDVPMSFLGKKNIKYGFLKFEQDLMFEKALPRRIKNVYHIFELYDGKFPKIFRANTMATLLLLDWSRNGGVENFIYLSTGEVYGKGTKLDEKSPCNPHGFYATTKYHSEMLMKFYRKFFKIHTIRVFFPFGKDVEQGYVYEMANAIKSGGDFNGYYNNISATFVDDLVNPILNLRGQKDSSIHNIGGRAVGTDNVVEEIARVLQKSPKKFETGKNSLIADNRVAIDVLGYSETSMNEAIQHSFENFK